MTKYRANIALAFAGAVIVTNAFAHSHLENKVRDRALDQRPQFVELDARTKRITAEGVRKTSTSAVRTTFSVSPLYASNAQLDPNGEPAFFVGSSVGIGYERIDDDAKSVLSVGYEVGGVFYENSADESNEVDQVVGVGFQKELAPGIVARVGANDTQIDVDYHSLLNVASGFAEVRSGLTENYVGGFAYTWQKREARLPVASLRTDADAVRHIPLVYVATDLARYGSGLPQVAFAYSYYFNLADGADEDFAAQRFALTVSNWRIPFDFFGMIEASFEDREGENFSSRLGGLARRGDELARVQLTLTRPLMAVRKSHLGLVVGYEKSSSNLASANYHGWTYAATVTREF